MLSEKITFPLLPSELKILIPVSILHFLKLKKGFKNENKLNDQEPEDVL